VPGRETGTITGMCGVHGSVSGFVTVNMSERMAIHAVEGLLDQHFASLTPQVIDGAGEITNLVVGGIKNALSRSEWAFSQITVPSVIVGNGYSIAYARGLDCLSVTFEHEDAEAVLLTDRLMQVCVSLLRK
jgi:CheY-specific phosphatase CheX